MAGSRCVTYKSIRRVPRRIMGLTMPTIARPNTSSSGENIVIPVALLVLFAACEESLGCAELEVLSVTIF